MHLRRAVRAPVCPTPDDPSKVKKRQPGGWVSASEDPGSSWAAGLWETVGRACGSGIVDRATRGGVSAFWLNALDRGCDVGVALDPPWFQCNEKTCCMVIQLSSERGVVSAFPGPLPSVLILDLMACRLLIPSVTFARSLMKGHVDRMKSLDGGSRLLGWVCGRW